VLAPMTKIRDTFIELESDPEEDEKVFAETIQIDDLISRVQNGVKATLDAIKLKAKSLTTVKKEEKTDVKVDKYT
jgi:hypothetical protein